MKPIKTLLTMHNIIIKLKPSFKDKMYKNGLVILVGFLVIVYNLNAQDIDKMLHSKPISIHGGISVQGNYNLQSNGGNWQFNQPYNLIVTGNTNISIYGFDVPLSFSWSPQSSRFQQPFTQYSIRPRYKWIQLYLGYQNVYFHPYTLAGQTMYGYGFDLTPGKFKIGAIYGRFSKATVLDTITQSLQPVNFSRKGFAAHIGYGSSDNYFDLSVIRANDDSSSLGNVDLNKVSLKYGQDIAPAYNLAAGVKARFSITKRLYWEGSGGVSIYTRDIRNTTYPEDNSAIYNTLKKLIIINATSEYYKAYQIAMGYNANNWSLKLQYQFLDPNFRTMGAFNITNDVKNYTIAPSVYLFKKRLSIVSSLGIQTDNLNKLKAQTSKRFITNVSVNANVSRSLNISGNYSNYSINVNPEFKKIADTIRITQSNKNLSFTPVLNFSSKGKTHTIIFNGMYSRMNDFSNVYAPGQQSRTVEVMIGLVNYTINFIDADWSLQTGINHTKTKGQGLEDQNSGGTLGINKNFLKKTMSINITSSYSLGKRNKSDIRIFNLSAQANYKIQKHHNFSIHANRNSSSLRLPGGNQNISYLRIDVIYSYQF